MTQHEDYFTHLTLGQTLNRVWNIFTDTLYMRLFLKVAVIIGLPAIFLCMTTTAIVVHKMIPGGKVDTDDPAFVVSNLFAFAVTLFARSLVTMLVCTVGDAAMIRATFDIYAGNCRDDATPSWYICIRHAVNRLHHLLLAGFLAFCGIAAAFPFLLVPGIYLSLSWAVVAPVLMVELEHNGLSALSRSWELSENNRCYILAVMSVLGFAQGLVSFGINLILTGNNQVLLNFTPLGVMVSMVPAFAFFPLFSIAEAVLYLNLRVFREGLTYEQFRREIDQANSRFRASAGSTTSSADVSTDYRQVPLVDGNDGGDLV